MIDSIKCAQPPLIQTPLIDSNLIHHRYNPYGLQENTRESLIRVFLSAIHEKEREYVQCHRRLAQYTAQKDHGKTHIETHGKTYVEAMTSLCETYEQYIRHYEQSLRDYAQTYKTIMGSDLWTEYVEELFQKESNV